MKILFTILLTTTLQTTFAQEVLMQFKSDFLGTGYLDKDQHPVIERRVEVPLDILFKKDVIEVHDEANSFYKIKSTNKYSDNSSVAIRYECVDESNRECVVMFVVYADISLLNVYYPLRNNYLRYYILPKN